MKKEKPPINEDIAHQRKKWVMERVGWAVMGLIVLAALSGLLGSGPLSKAEARESTGALRVEYRRFERYGSKTELKVHITGDLLTGDTLKLSLLRSYTEKVDITRISPEPESTQLAGDQLVYVFPLTDTNRATAITLHMEGRSYGKVKGKIGVKERHLEFEQFFYP